MSLDDLLFSCSELEVEVVVEVSLDDVLVICLLLFRRDVFFVVVSEVAVSIDIVVQYFAKVDSI